MLIDVPFSATAKHQKPCFSIFYNVYCPQKRSLKYLRNVSWTSTSVFRLNYFVGQTFIFEKIVLKLRHFNSDTLRSNLVYLAKERRTSQEFFILTGELKTIERN